MPRSAKGIGLCLLSLAGMLLFSSLLQSGETPDPTSPPPVRFEPVIQRIEGWTVFVDPALLPGGGAAELGRQALRMLADHLYRITLLMPPDRLEALRHLEIWIEEDHPVLKSMQYHPNINWLKTHGHDPRLTKKVHITQARSLLERHQLVKHPMVVLHELAHAYHDQVLDFEHPEILKAYREARDNGSYDQVLLFTGERVRHYGMNDQKEYFAEGTEAYFGRNDFYPFVRAELAEHDPALHRLLEEIWGPLP